MAYCLEPFLVVLDFLEFIVALLLRSVLDSLFLFTSPIWYFLEAFQGASHHQKIFNTVLITGASGGVGRALAIDLATINPNITLFLLGRNDERLMETKQLCQNAMKKAANPNASDDQSGPQGSVDCYVVDNRKREEVSRIITQCDDKRPIDLFIANAGMGTIQTQHNDWFERYQEMVDNNIIGTFNTVFPIMKRYISICFVVFQCLVQSTMSVSTSISIRTFRIRFITRRRGHIAFNASIASYSVLLGTTSAFSATKVFIRFSTFRTSISFSFAFVTSTFCMFCVSC